MRAIPSVARSALLVVAIYARISLDRHDGEGVGRQLADCREIVAQRWPGAEVREYVDNDISAFRAKRRPEYDRLLADLHLGELGAVVAYHPDRLYRRPADLEAFIDAVQTAGAEVATVRAGDVDLSTASGRMVARILGAVSRQESERIGERVARAKRERAAQGRPAGGGKRPFGLTADRTALVDDEADEIRRTAAALVAGATIGSEVARLNAAGIRTTGGRHWSTMQLRRTITAPYVAGLRSYRGEIVGEAAWPPILDRGTWELLRAEADSRRHGPGRPPGAHSLLSGLLQCSKCGRRLFAHAGRRARTYRCNPSPTTRGRGCGSISITAALADAHVTAEVGGWLDRPATRAALDAFLAYGDAAAAGAAAERDELERRMVALAQRWGDGRIGDEEYDAARAVLAERRGQIDTALGAPRPGLRATAAQIAQAWGEFTTQERRQAVEMLVVCPIPVLPGRDADRRIVLPGDRLVLTPIWEAQRGRRE